MRGFVAGQLQSACGITDAAAAPSPRDNGNRHQRRGSNGAARQRQVAAHSPTALDPVGGTPPDNTTSRSRSTPLLIGTSSARRPARKRADPLLDVAKHRQAIEMRGTSGIIEPDAGLL
jgi:hypothetical protein